MKWVLLCPQGWIKMEVFSLGLFHHGKAQQPAPLDDTETRLRETTFPRHLVPWFGAKQRTKSMLFVSFSICDTLLEQQKQVGQFLPYSSVILERQIMEMSWGWKITIWLLSLWMGTLSKCLSFYVMVWDCYTQTLVLSSHPQEHLPFSLGFPPVFAPFHRVHTRLQDSQPCPIVEGQVVAPVYFNCGGNWGLTRHYHEKPFIWTSAH